MLTALLVFVPLALALIRIERRLLATTGSSVLQSWLADHLYLPLMRAGALLVFVSIAHPQLYGLAGAPSLGSLITSGQYRFDQLVNVMLLISLLLPLLPFLNRLAGITLALQGMCATALIASWMARESAFDIRLLPDAGLVLRIAAMLLAARWVARLLAKELAVGPPEREVIIEAALMAAQLPAVIIYARYLGSQLAG